MNGLNNQAVANYRDLTTGKDGQLFITAPDGTNHFLGEVDTFQVQVNTANADWQPVGSMINFAVGTGVSMTLTFTEAVIRDDITLAPFLDSIRAGEFPLFSFQGKLTQRMDANGGQPTEQRIVFKSCTPDGAIDLMHLQPGEIVKRNWSFRVNEMPEILAKLGQQ